MTQMVRQLRFKLRQVDRASENFDPVTKRPMGGLSYGATVTLKGQFSYVEQERREDVLQGEQKVTEGYFLIERWLLAARSITIQNGDQVSEIDGEAVEYEIFEVEQAGSYDHHRWKKVGFRRSWESV